MVIPALKSLLDRIETWPEERQERLAFVVELLDEEPGDEGLQISDADLEELRRRMDDKNAPTISLEEFERRMARWLT